MRWFCLTDPPDQGTKELLGTPALGSAAQLHGRSTPASSLHTLASRQGQLPKGQMLLLCKTSLHDLFLSNHAKLGQSAK